MSWVRKAAAKQEQVETMPPYTIQHSVENGIERIRYLPARRRRLPPILMVHGMWHGAWCWQPWQELLAEWGWESHAFSLPGHGMSPAQRPVYFCTLDYYLRFLKAEVARMERKPILIGHSMGGALVQWYLKYAGDNLPAAVLAAPWNVHGNFSDGGIAHWLNLDPLGVLLVSLTGSANPYIRTPAVAARKLISPGAIYSPKELHARLGPESVWIMIQHNRPFWQPPVEIKTPLLWLAGEADQLISVEAQQRAAADYHAPCIVAPGAAHNLMMEPTYAETALTIHQWLCTTLSLEA